MYTLMKKDYFKSQLYSSGIYKYLVFFNEFDVFFSHDYSFNLFVFLLAYFIGFDFLKKYIGITFAEEKNNFNILFSTSFKHIK